EAEGRRGPGCGVVEIKDGKATCWSGSQKTHFVRDGVAAILKMPAEDVRTIWVTGPGSYGRNDAGDAAMDAAVLAQAVGRPVRVQNMREPGAGWGPQGPGAVYPGPPALGAAG